MLVSHSHSVVHLNLLSVECLINSKAAFGLIMVFHGGVFFHTLALLCIVFTVVVALFYFVNFMLSRFVFYYLSVIISLMYVLRWLRVEEFL